MFYPWGKKKNTIKKSKHTDAKRYQNIYRQQDKRKGTMDLKNSQKTINKMKTVSPFLSIITLNAKRWNYPSYYHPTVNKKTKKVIIQWQKGQYIKKVYQL